MTHLVANTICQQTASGRDGTLSAKADRGSLSPLPCAGQRSATSAN